MNLTEIKMRYRTTLEEANRKQRDWFLTLTRIADSLWARANGNPLCISDQMRLAAKELNLDNKPWLMDFKTIELTACVACGTLKNPAFPVCQNCKAIDPNYKGPEIKFAS